jgi:hypothetical protein
MAQQGYSWVKKFLTLYVAGNGTLVVESIGYIRVQQVSTLPGGCHTSAPSF